MDKAGAIKIIEKLADGMHPETGQPLQPGGVLDRPEVIRALNIATRTLRASHRSQRALQAAPNAGKSWGKSEDQRLLADWEMEKDLRVLANRHGRTAIAIRSRLIKHGKIEP
ncbi:MAG: hypothetical protein FVQ81_18710 [Candidatus Glassbacteria bacterium]|nr:hypothetical protein [Candidatus Glassbacteria bacterium]